VSNKEATKEPEVLFGNKLSRRISGIDEDFFHHKRRCRSGNSSKYHIPSLQKIGYLLSSFASQIVYPQRY
jgi:hypothetical protein